MRIKASFLQPPPSDPCNGSGLNNEQIETIFEPYVTSKAKGTGLGLAIVKKIIEEINKLPAAQAEVLMLRVVSDLSVEEVAKIVKKNANSVRVLAHRGLATLKEAMGGSHE